MIYLSKHSVRLKSWIIFVVPKNPFNVTFIGMIPEFSFWNFEIFLKHSTPQTNAQINDKMVFIIHRIILSVNIFVALLNSLVILWQFFGKFIFNHPKKIGIFFCVWYMVVFKNLEVGKILVIYLRSEWQIHSTDCTMNATLQILKFTQHFLIFKNFSSGHTLAWGATWFMYAPLPLSRTFFPFFQTVTSKEPA